MKTITTLILLALLILTSSHAQMPESYPPDFRDAMTYGAKAKMTLKIIDDGGKPVSNALAKVQFSPPKARKLVIDGGLSDSNGIVVAEGITTSTIPGDVSKDGYYNTWFKFRSGDPADPHDYAKKAKNGRWLPWNPTITLVLREVRKPIPLYVAWVDFDKGFPSDTDVGFDCERHDYVAPHGDGKNSDFLVRISSLDISGHDKACRLTLSAIDNGGGFVVKKKELSSKLVSDYEAPADGYSPEFRTSKTTKLKFYEKNPDDVSEDEYLILKSRIVRDQNGEIISANYGKIYGPVEYVFSLERGRGAIKFLYYFNPTPNDRNLEFDGKNNLFKPGWKSTLRWSQDP